MTGNKRPACPLCGQPKPNSNGAPRRLQDGSVRRDWRCHPCRYTFATDTECRVLSLARGMSPGSLLAAARSAQRKRGTKAKVTARLIELGPPLRGEWKQLADQINAEFGTRYGVKTLTGYFTEACGTIPERPEKRCKDCKQVLSAECFHPLTGWRQKHKHLKAKGSGQAKYLRSRCKECDGKRAAEQMRARKLAAYKAEVAYDELVTSQQGRCAICNRSDPTPDQPRYHAQFLVIDHSHTTGRFRALLCGTCNCGLGHFFDNPDWLRAAAAYIERHSQSSAEPPSRHSPPAVPAPPPPTRKRGGRPRKQPVPDLTPSLPGMG